MKVKLRIGQHFDFGAHGPEFRAGCTVTIPRIAA
jgi:hypothetical protein